MSAKFRIVNKITGAPSFVTPEEWEKMRVTPMVGQSKNQSSYYRKEDLVGDASKDIPEELRVFDSKIKNEQKELAEKNKGKNKNKD